MKRIALYIAALLMAATAGPAVGGYRDLKKEMDAYTPPALLRQPVPAPPAVSAPPVDPAAIEDARDRWTAALKDKGAAAASAPIAPEIATAAGSAERTGRLLKQDFSLSTTRALIRLRNPAVSAAEDRFRAALEGFDQVSALDDILGQYTAFTESAMAGVGPMRSMDTVAMRFPYPGMTALKGQVAEKNVEIQWYDAQRVARDTLAQGSQAYWNLLYTHRAVQITADTLARMDHLESVATTRYGAGKTSYQDVIKIRIGREKLAEQLATLEQQRVNLETELLALVDLPAGLDLKMPATRNPDLSLPALADLNRLALAHRQELNRMRAMVSKMGRMLEMTETMIQPGFSQNYSLFGDRAAVQVGSAGTRPSFDTTVSATRGDGLPKSPWTGTQNAYLRETRRKRDALQNDLADAVARTGSMVRNGWFDLDRAIRERRLYRDRLVDLSRTSLDVSTRGYESGNVSFADVIASYTQWLEVNLSSERRNSDVGIARAELERRVGTSLSPLPLDANSGGAGGSP